MINYIICGTCGRIFNSMEAASEHQRYCRDSKSGAVYIIPPITFISGSEIREVIKAQNDNKKIVTNYCPLNKPQSSFPCPRCIHSKSVSEIKEFFKTSTCWCCKYPEVVNPTIKMKIIKGKEADSKNIHLSKAVWDCPNCKKFETVRYDMKKGVFVCWECCKLFSFEEGKVIFDGFELENNK